MNAEPRADVLILGGGPAGSTAGALLAAAGIATTIVEAEPHPRFHVGESLLPHSLPLLDRLGVHDQVRALPHTQHKNGASFATHTGERSAVYWFDAAAAPAIPHAYQVRRDEFDALLLDNARARGAQVLEGWRATRPEWDGRRLAGLWLRPPGGDERLVRARAVVDASGQQAFLASRMGWKRVVRGHRKLAAAAHFENVWRADGREAGNIVIVVTRGGWFWFIPFGNGTTSVGVVLDVTRARELGTHSAGIFEAAVAATPEAARRLAGARGTVAHFALQNFSFGVTRRAGDGFVLVGDAAGFLDPIFSTGVFIATTTAECAAEEIGRALARHGRVDAADLAGSAALSARLQGLFFSLIRSYYDPHFLAFFFNPERGPRIVEAVVSLLAGDVLRAGTWRRLARFRGLQALGQLQRLSVRLGRPLVPPLPAGPSG